MSDDDGNGSGNKGLEGVSGGLQGGLFENSAAEEQMLADSAPFLTMPRGGSRRGVPNKRTTAMRELYLKMGLPHPMLWMGQVLSMTVDQLHTSLGGGTETSKLDVLDIQRKVAADLAPYLESKMPAKLDVQPGEGLPVLVVRELDTPAAMRQARADGALAIDDDLAEALGRDEQYQAVSGGAAAGSHGEGSHGASHPIDDAGKSDDEASD